MAWTKAQQKVIDTRNKNLLVSAAAGSGKTAVLVERIISMISEGEHPLDIDRLLVVTFTNAAAAEMRGRIGEAIDKKLKEQPDHLHLQKQISLLQSAQITTIHSFCLNVIRNYFHLIDLDPSFKIAEESEITLLKSDVIAAILERWYDEGKENFHDFIESYSYSKSDKPIEELILQLYSFSMSAPWPKKWIDKKKKMFELSCVAEMSKAPWMEELLGYIKAVLNDLTLKNTKALSICDDFDGPLAYAPALKADQRLLESLCKAETYEEYVQTFSSIQYERLSSKKQDGVSQEKKDEVKALREEVKKGIKDIQGQFFFQSPEEMLKDIQAVGNIMKVLFDLVLEFMEEFAKKKEEKNLIDFNDLEHYALKILVSEQGSSDSEYAGNETDDDAMIPTLAAMELSEHFDEILIDEYQDSNMVQETILKSISRESSGYPNRFMVGDVKQSIYKFRLAMPEIFMEKYLMYSCDDFTSEGGKNPFQRIDLDRNFRSRRIVLEYVNQIFEQIMLRSIGGIVYDDAASLKYGELFEEILKEEELARFSSDVKERIAGDVELLLVTDDITTDAYLDLPKDSGEESSDNSYDAEEAVYTKKEIEAMAIARKIKELTDPQKGMLVFDRKEKIHRPATYRDIVILLRSMSGWSEIFVNTLMQEGIFAYADTGTGYFQTLEIRTILNMLRILDNPRQDIPFTGVLYSPIVGMTTKELAMIRAVSRNTGMYLALTVYAEEGQEDSLRAKVLQFLTLLDDLRSLVNHKPIHELIQMVLDQTGYYYYVCAMPGGDRRKANIDMLISQAVRFEKGSYSGLFHFIRYIEKLHKYEVDYGEAATSGEQDNTVRIMSIHKSKGLEFPIVFVAGMKKQFNTQDIRNKIALHSELGVGPEYVNSKERTKVPTLIKKVIQKKIQIENLGEELRVLYVAMTRAKEKLILTGFIDSIDEIKKKDFTFFELMSAKSYMDWVLPATVNKIDWIPDINNIKSKFNKNGISITVVSKEEVLTTEITKQLFLNKDEANLIQLNPDQIYNQSIRDEIKNRFNYSYRYQKDTGIKVKMTVSELKKMGQFSDQEQSIYLFQPSSEKEFEQTKEVSDPVELTTEIAATVPNFVSQKEVVSGTDRGTLYHKVLELVDLQKVYNQEDLMSELHRLVRNKRLKESDLELLNLNYIFGFIKSDVASRMRLAQDRGLLYKEKQFVMGLNASEVIPEVESKEFILVQGIIDVFFEEDGSLVLLDYKSDLVDREEQLITRYRIQLEYYRRALEQMLNKKVKEIIIYSLPRGKEIRIDG